MTAVALWVVFGGLSGLFATIAFLIAIRAMQAPQLRIGEWLIAIAFIAPIGGAIIAIAWYSRRLGGAASQLEKGAESTARLAAIVESSQDAIIGKTLDGRITTWNAGAERMYGFTAAEAIGKPISMIVPKAGLVELGQILEGLRRGESTGRFETARLRKDGRTIVASVAITPIAVLAAGNSCSVGSQAANGATHSCRSSSQIPPTLFETITAMRGRSRVFMVGIGSAPNTYLMTRAAELGRGAFTHIGSVDQVEERMRGLFAKLENPAVTGLSVKFSDASADVTPAAIPDVYRDEPLVLAARLDKLAGSMEIKGRIGDRPWVVTLPLANAAEGKGLSKLWARRKISDAEVARTTRQVGPEDADKTILALALEHQLVTRLTSLVAVDKTPSRPDGEPRSAQRELMLGHAARAAET